MEYLKDLMSPEWQWGLVFTDLVVVIALVNLFKYKIGLMSNCSVKEELSEKDNPAFGILMAFSFFSFFMIMSSATSGDDKVPFVEEVLLMLGYGVSGMILLLVSRYLFDKTTMSKFDITQEIKNRNISVSIVDGSNMLATALIVFTYMGWVKGTELTPLLIVAYGWFISQVSLSILSYLRMKYYHKAKKGDGEDCFESAIKNGNTALAIRFSAYKLSFAFSILIASINYPYTQHDAFWSANAIFSTGVLISIIVMFITKVLKIIAFIGIDFRDEIENQNNIGMAFIEAAIVLGISFVMYGVMR